MNHKAADLQRAEPLPDAILSAVQEAIIVTEGNGGIVRAEHLGKTKMAR